MTDKLSLLAVYAHPDDEQGVSGALARYARAGVEVTLVCATRGEVGEIAPGTKATRETLGPVRENELRCAAALLGVQNLYFLGYRDSGMVGTPDNQHPAALHQADLAEIAEKVVRRVRQHQPQVLVTFDPSGGYGHPDHIRVHRATLVAFAVAGDPSAFPAHFTEGLAPWTPRKLYWPAFTRSRFKLYREFAEKIGMEIPPILREIEARGVPDEAVTTRLDVSEFADLKLQALACHATQVNPDSPMAKIPPEIRREVVKTEMYILAEARGIARDGVETDLFAGLR